MQFIKNPKRNAGRARAAALLIGAASVALVVGAAVLRRQTALFLWMLAASVACWRAGNVVWLLTGDPSSAVPWWLAFLILTIAAERLELTRVRPLPRSASALFRGIAALLPVAAALAPWQPLPALRLFGAGELLLALWLIRYDIARRTVRQRGLTRFVAVCLLSGYGRLAVSGALSLDGALAPGHPAHDAALHALTLGFVFSMILGHTPIIVPAVAQLRVAYRPFFYAPLALLHATVALRVAGGLLDVFTLRRAGGEAAAVAIASFAVTLAIGIGLARQAKTRRNIGKHPLWITTSVVSTVRHGGLALEQGRSRAILSQGLRAFLPYDALRDGFKKARWGC